MGTVTEKKIGYSAAESLGNYKILVDMLKKGPVNSKMIMRKLGVPQTTAYSMINNLSLDMPIWSPKRGTYKLLERSDFN